MPKKIHFPFLFSRQARERIVEIWSVTLNQTAGVKTINDLGPGFDVRAKKFLCVEICRTMSWHLSEHFPFSFPIASKCLSLVQHLAGKVFLFRYVGAKHFITHWVSYCYSHVNLLTSS